MAMTAVAFGALACDDSGGAERAQSAVSPSEPAVTSSLPPSTGVDARVEISEGQLATRHSHGLSVVVTNQGPESWANRVTLRILNETFLADDQDVMYGTPYLDVQRDGAWSPIRALQLGPDEWTFELGQVRLASGETRTMKARIAVDTSWIQPLRFSLMPHIGPDVGDVGAVATAEFAGVSITDLKPADGCRMEDNDERCVGLLTVTNHADTAVSDVEVCGDAEHPEYGPGGYIQEHVADTLEFWLGGKPVRMGLDTHPVSLGSFAPRASRTFYFQVSLNGSWRPGMEESGAADFHLNCTSAHSYDADGYVYYEDQDSSISAAEPGD